MHAEQDARFAPSEPDPGRRMLVTHAAIPVVGGVPGLSPLAGTGRSRSLLVSALRNSVRVQGRKLAPVPLASSPAVYAFAHSMWDCREPQKARTNQSGCWLRRATC